MYSTTTSIGITQNANVLSDWAKNLSLPSTEATYLNFLASHDGIGMTPAHGLLSDTQISEMVQRTEALGGNVSTRRQADGSDIIYELNINYLDALSDPETPASPSLNLVILIGFSDLLSASLIMVLA